MKTKEILRLIEQEENLPVLPQLFYRIVETASNPETSISELSNLILEDQVLTGRVLKIANSAYYAIPQKVSTVTRAVMILGFVTLKNFITAITVIDTLKNKCNCQLFETFWIHALSCALSGSILAQKLGSPHHEEAMVAGLIHDCGKLFLGYQFTQEYQEVAALVQNGTGPSLR